jgi:hypothetical protein
VKSHLHKGILVEELDELVAALQTASAGACHELGHGVLGSPIVPGQLLVQVLEDNDDEPDYCEKQGAESDAAEVVSEEPPYALAKDHY